MLGSQKLPKDVLNEVLVLLSVKSLERLKSVSTHWYALIKSETFTNRHLLKQQRSCRVLLLKRHLPEPTNDDVLSFYDQHSLQLDKELRPYLFIRYIKDIKSKFKPRQYHEDVTLVGPCNGLICIFLDGFYMICNPTLRQFKKLPPPTYICPKRYSLNNIGVGFGVSRNMDYKVLLIGCFDPENTGTVSVCKIILLYNATTNSWRQIDDDAIAMKYAFYSSCSGIFFNGACHWNAKNLSTNRPDNVFTFDISTEDFRMFEYSDAMEVTSGDNPYLMIYNECISIARYDHGDEELYIEIWVMKEYGIKESWIKQFVVGPDTVVRSFLGFRNEEYLLVECNKGRLGYCDLHTKEIKNSHIRGDEGTLQALVYEESLICVDHVINSGVQI